MLKQKRSRKAAKAHLQLLTNRKRLGWFAVLLMGLTIIQFGYNLHNGEPRVLGYSTQITAQKLLSATNSSRRTHDEADLNLSATLTEAAQRKAEDMIAKNYWDHITPSGQQPWVFIQQTGYQYRAAGENLAYGFATSDEVISGWMNSETHRENLLGQYSDVGFGIAKGARYQGGENTLVVAFYGQPSGLSTLSPLANVATTSLRIPSAHVDGLAVVATGAAPWASYASLGLIGTATIGFVVTHLELLRLGWYRSKHFLAIHPIFDAMVIMTLALAMVYAAGGFIR